LDAANAFTGGANAFTGGLGGLAGLSVAELAANGFAGLLQGNNALLQGNNTFSNSSTQYTGNSDGNKRLKMNNNLSGSHQSSM
jgi:hypothetical protein